MTGLTQAGSRTNLSATDTILAAFGKVAKWFADLAAVAFSGAYSDLSGRPTLGTASALNVGTSANNVVQLDGSARLPAVSGALLTNLPASQDTRIPTSGNTVGRIARFTNANGTVAGTTGIYEDASGNVGIGTTTPRGVLDAVTASGAGIYVAGAGTYPRIYVGGSDTGVAAIFSRIKASATIYFGEDADAGAVTFRGTGGLTASASKASGTLALFVSNFASNSTNNKARVALGPHSGYNSGNAPYVEAYNAGNDAGLAFAMPTLPVGRMRIASLRPPL